MKREIAFFDFDGTITTKDTLLEFIKYVKGNFQFYFGFLINLPYLVAFKIGIISNQKAKEKILSFFFNKMPVNVFNEHCNQFVVNVMPQLIRPKAQKEIEKLRQTGVTLVIVSASPENWVKKWADKHSFECIATILETKDETLNGKIVGENCHGNEKVKQIRHKYPLENYDVIYAYGDSKGDLPMLGLATVSLYKPFK